jgi:predicted amidohydrolase YtcJ
MDVQIKGHHSEDKEEDSALNHHQIIHVQNAKTEVVPEVAPLKYLFQVYPLFRGVLVMEASNHQNAETVQKVEDLKSTNI